MARSSVCGGPGIGEVVVASQSRAALADNQLIAAQN
jgi:hypothetical protein